MPSIHVDIRHIATDKGAPCARRPPDKCLQVARALVTRPALLLADEPTGNLDSKSAAEVFQLFRRFNREFGCAVLLVTHDPRLSEQCDRTLVDGRIESDRQA